MIQYRANVFVPRRVLSEFVAAYEEYFFGSPDLVNSAFERFLLAKKLFLSYFPDIAGASEASDPELAWLAYSAIRGVVSREVRSSDVPTVLSNHYYVKVKKERVSE